MQKVYHCWSNVCLYWNMTRFKIDMNVGGQEHILYGPEDFTDEEYDQGNRLAEYVIDGGLGICKKCGKAEIDLQHPCWAKVRER